MVEARREALDPVHERVDLELIIGAAAGVGPVADLLVFGAAAAAHPGGAEEQLAELVGGERPRAGAAPGAALLQHLGERPVLAAQAVEVGAVEGDLPARRRLLHRGQRLAHAGIGVGAAVGIAVAAFARAVVEEQVVEFPLGQLLGLGVGERLARGGELRAVRRPGAGAGRGGPAVARRRAWVAGRLDEALLVEQGEQGERVVAVRPAGSSPASGSRPAVAAKRSAGPRQSGKMARLRARGDSSTVAPPSARA